MASKNIGWSLGLLPYKENQMKQQLVWSLIVASLLAFSCNGTKQDQDKEEVIKVDTTAVQGSPMVQLNKKILDDPNDPELYAQRAELFLDLEDLEAAVQDVERALALDSTKASFWVLKGKIGREGLYMTMAREAFDRALQLEPEGVEGNLAIAEMYIVLEDLQKALDHANTALKGDIYNAEAYYLKGLCFHEAGDTARAISTLQTCVEQDPEHYKAYMMLGLIHQNIHNDLAIAYYDNAIKSKPQSLEARYNKGKYLQDHEQPEEAMAVYRDLVELRPDYQEAHFNMGYVQMFEQNYPEAIEHYTKAISIHPGYYEAYYNRGYSYELSGEIDLARQDYKQALNIRGDFTLAAKGLNRLE